MRNQFFMALIGVAVSVSAASANVTTTLNLASARASVGPGASVSTNQTVGGRSGVWTLDRGSDPTSYANVW